MDANESLPNYRYALKFKSMNQKMVPRFNDTEVPRFPVAYCNDHIIGLIYTVNLTNTKYL